LAVGVGFGICKRVVEVKSGGALGLWLRLGLWEARDGESEVCEKVESRLLLHAGKVVSAINDDIPQQPNSSLRFSVMSTNFFVHPTAKVRKSERKR